MRLDERRFELGDEAILPHDELCAPFVLALALVEGDGDGVHLSDGLRDDWMRREERVWRERKRRDIDCGVDRCWGAGQEGLKQEAVARDALDREEEVRLERDLRVRRVRSTALQDVRR